MLADRYGWTPEQIMRMDPDYIAEVLIRLHAESDAAEARRQAEERERKRQERRARSPRGEDVSLSEIIDG